jgi:hypothetical protein
MNGARQKAQDGVCGFRRRKDILHALMIERMTVLYDIAAALFYLRESVRTNSQLISGQCWCVFHALIDFVFKKVFSLLPGG